METERAESAEPGSSEVLIGAGDGELSSKVLARSDTPAHVRRGLRLENAIETLYQGLAARRKEVGQGLALTVRLLVRELTGLEDLRSHLQSEEDLQIVRQLVDEFSPDCRWSTKKAKDTLVRWRVQELCDSIRRFNQRWARVVQNTDLSEINRLIESYNRYYLLEKECALRSPRLAARNFRPVPPITERTLLERYPLSRLPRLRP
jgi:hypothetical protein